VPDASYFVSLVPKALVGLVLNANAYTSWINQQKTSAKTETESPNSSLKEFAKSQPFSVVRLFLIPYCVSSYSGAINSVQGGPIEFVSVFPSDARSLVICFGCAVGFPFSLFILSRASMRCVESQRSQQPVQ
jgi:hypothetical protein